MPLREDGYYYRLAIEPEALELEGNASAIDEATDQEIIDWIRRELDVGNDWAWCVVIVTCQHKDLPEGVKGEDVIGGCSYKSEQDFRETSGYFADMQQRARNDLDLQVAKILVAATTPGRAS